MAQVPARFVADLPVHWEEEALACLGQPIRWAGLTVPPITLGTMALLEFLDSPFVAAPLECRAVDYLRAVYVFRARQQATIDVLDWIDDGKPATPGSNALDRHAANLACQMQTATMADHARLRRWYAAAFAGYQMIPPSNEPSGLWLFGGPTLGSSVAHAGECLGVTWDELLWSTPLCLLGFTVAALAKSNGAKGVSRPKDPTDIKRQLRLANEREAAGQLHPWQEREPELYPLTTEQKKHPAAIARHALLLADPSERPTNA